MRSFTAWRLLTLVALTVATMSGSVMSAQV